MDKTQMKFEAPAVALEKWNPHIKAAKPSDNETINIYSTIGEYGDGSGMTPKIVSAVLRKAEGKDITVNINSPGGDFFDGLAIHSLLSEYEGNVKVRILGLAASAASVVALAGDEIEIAESGFFMIHNAWTVAMGNKHDMRDVQTRLQKFDESMANLYAKKTGIDTKAISKMMDAETWLNADNSLELKFADALMGGEDIEIEDDENMGYNSSLKRIDVALAKAGMPRTERRALIKDLTGTPRATEPTPCAGNVELTKALERLHKTISS